MTTTILFKFLALLIIAFTLTSFSVNDQHSNPHGHHQNTNGQKQYIFISMMDTMMIRMDEAVVGILMA